MAKSYIPAVKECCYWAGQSAWNILWRSWCLELGAFSWHHIIYKVTELSYNYHQQMIIIIWQRSTKNERREASTGKVSRKRMKRKWQKDRDIERAQMHLPWNWMTEPMPCGIPDKGMRGLLIETPTHTHTHIIEQILFSATFITLRI